MAQDLNIWIRIISDYTAVTHLVTGLGMTFVRLCLLGVLQLSLLDIITFVWAFFELCKGGILWEGITENKPVMVRTHLVLSLLTTVVELGACIFYLNMFWSLPLLLICIAYFWYDCIKHFVVGKLWENMLRNGFTPEDTTTMNSVKNYTNSV